MPPKLWRFLLRLWLQACSSMFVFEQLSFEDSQTTSNTINVQVEEAPCKINQGFLDGCGKCDILLMKELKKIQCKFDHMTKVMDIHRSEDINYAKLLDEYKRIDIEYRDHLLKAEAKNLVLEREKYDDMVEFNNDRNLDPYYKKCDICKQYQMCDSCGKCKQCKQCSCHAENIDVNHFRKPVGPAIVENEIDTPVRHREIVIKPEYRGRRNNQNSGSDYDEGFLKGFFRQLKDN